MKLEKDKFSKEFLSSAQKKQIELFKDFINKYDLKFSFGNYQKGYSLDNPSSIKSFSITHDNVNAYHNTEIKNKNIIWDRFYFLDEENNPSHDFHFNSVVWGNIFNDIYEKMNDDEKPFFLKTIGSKINPRQFFLIYEDKLKDEDFWLYLRHINSFYAKPIQKNDFLCIMEQLNNKSIDSEKKVQSLAQFLNFYKTIVRRDDLSPRIVSFINKNIDPQYFYMFQKIIGKEINVPSLAAIPEDILQQNNQTICLLIDKEKFFSRVAFSNIPNAQHHDYNRYLKQINEIIMLEQNKKLLGIQYINFIEFNSSKDPARVYVDSSEQGFKQDIKNLYFNILINLTGEFKSGQKLSEASVNSAINYYILSNSINDSSQQLEQKKKPSLKI